MKKRRLFALLAAAGLAAFGIAGCAGGESGGGDGGDAEPPTLSISDTYAWIGYPASEFTPIFSDPTKAEELTYEYDESLISISPEDHTVTALAEGTATVTVTSESYSASFNVYCEEVDKTDDAFDLTTDWSSRAQGYELDWMSNGNDGQTTIFIGDSFFDIAFWDNFYTDYYSGKDALIWGIGSTTSYTWETLTTSLLANTSPRNIAMHVGTNDIYDLERTAEQTISSLQRIFTLMHSVMPETHIWYFSITQRTYVGADERYPTVNAVNAAMIEWCEGKDWITLLDTSPDITWDMLRDGIHPFNYEYGVFTQALEEGGCQIADL